jgi:two-component system LytT family response regulator
MKGDEVRIIIVEDNVQEQRFLHDTIRKMNSNVKFYFSNTAENALQIAYEEPIDIFILDIELTDKDSGILLAKKIRRINQYFNSPIIFSTSFGNYEMKVFREVRCQTFILKPLESNKIVKAYLDAMKSVNLSKENRNLDKKEKTFMLTYKGVCHIYILREIVLFKSIGNYVQVVCCNRHNGELDITVKHETLKNISLRLEEIEEGNFARCHKGFIVNMRYVTQIDWLHRNLKLRFNNSQKLVQNIWLGKVDTPITIPIGNKYKANFFTEEL